MPRAENDMEEGLTKQESNVRESISITHNPDIQIERRCNMKKCCMVVGLITAVTLGNIYISYLIYHNSNDGSGC